MTTDLLDILWTVNLAGSVAILAVLVLRWPLRRLAGTKLAYILWLLVPLVALASLAPARTITLAAETAGAPVAMSFAWQLMAEAPARAAETFDMEQTVLILWLTGALASAALVAWRHLRFLREVGPVTAIEGGVIQAERSRLGPAVVGALRPRVVLPADFTARFTPSEQAVILAHELNHIRAGHPLQNALIVLLQCLNWFNPLVHFGAFFARVDQELACDAAVAERFPGERRTYAEALLKTQLATAPLPLGCYWPGRSHNLLKERLKMLAQNSPGRRRMIAGAAFITTLSLGAGLTAWAAQPPRIQSAPAETANSAAEPVQTTSAVPDTVSLTNAGVGEHFGSIDEAIAAGDAVAVHDMGGTPHHVLLALIEKTRANEEGHSEQAVDYVMAKLEAFIDTSDGARLVFAPYKGPGLPFPDPLEGHFLIQRLTPDGMAQSINLLKTGSELYGRPYDLVAQAAAEAEAALLPPWTPPLSTREAIAQGNPYFALELGGSLTDAVDAIKVALSDEPEILADFERIIDTSDGGTLTDTGVQEDGAREIVRTWPGTSEVTTIFVRPGGMVGISR